MNKSDGNSIAQKSRTVLLKCPSCQSDLSGLPIDRIFFCNKCRTAIDFWEDPPGITPVEYCKLPDDSAGSVVYLPTWKYSLNVLVHGDDKMLEQVAQKAAPEDLWIFGCIFQKISLYGDPNVEFTKCNPPLDYSSEAIPLAGCQLRRWHADKLVVPMASAVIDQTQDVTDLSVDVCIRKRRIVAIPFHATKKHLRHMPSNFRINRASLYMQPWLDKLEEGLLFP